jgi:hypothetical protein
MSKILKKNNNGFCEQNFINLFRNKNPFVEKSLIYQFNKIKFPFFLIKKNEEKILTSLPCLSGPKIVHNDFEADFQNKILNKYQIDKGYLQIGSDLTGFICSSENYEIKKSTFKVYSINLKKLNYENFKKDTKSAIKKSLKKYSTLVTLSKSDRNIKNFYKYYKSISERKNFVSLYKFTYSDIKSLLNSKLWKLFSVYIKNKDEYNYLGGCIISLDRELNEADQTFMSYNYNYKNASKFLIYLSANFFRKYFNEYVLGGEITKNDNLGKFKESFSTKISFFTRLFFCKKNNKDYEKFKAMTEIERWPKI